MGKVKKIKVSKPVNKVALDKQIEDDKYAKAKNRSKERSRHDEEDSVSSIHCKQVLKTRLKSLRAYYTHNVTVSIGHSPANK